MNLQSPTSLLNSIQSMRDKLRNDKELLSDIKYDFTRMEKKKRPAPIETIMEESIQDPSMLISKREYASQRGDRNKVIELKKQHQKQLSRVRQEHQKEMKIVVEGFAKERQQIEENWKLKLEEQVKYISLLEEQVSSPSSPIQSERQNASKEQYDTVINKLLQQNTRLHQHLEQAREECQHWRRQARIYMTEIQTRTRPPLFNKNKQKLSKPQRENQSIKQTESIYADENEDRSNLGEIWSDTEIQNDEGKLKTIKQFPRGMLSQGQPSGLASRLR